jgi:uncharacterized ferredoxin-like protein
MHCSIRADVANPQFDTDLLLQTTDELRPAIAVSDSAALMPIAMRSSRCVGLTCSQAAGWRGSAKLLQHR